MTLSRTGTSQAHPAPVPRRVALISGIALTTVATSVDRRHDVGERGRAADPGRLDPGLRRRLQRRRQHAAHRLDLAVLAPATTTPAARPTGAPARSRTTPTSTANVSLDGAGNLRITPLRDGAGNWTSARIETNRQDFKPPAGGVLRIEGRIQMPNVTGAAALGYWPAFWALGARTAATSGTGRASASSTSWRTSTGSTRSGACCTAASNPGGPCNETTGIGASRACPGTTCQSAFHTYRFEWDRSITPEPVPLVRRRPAVPQREPGPVRRDDVEQHDQPRRLLHPAQRGHGRRLPGRASAADPTAATVPGRPMVVDYVAVWTAAAAARTDSPTARRPTTPPPGGGRDAYAVIQAESFNAQSGVGVETTTDTGGGQNIGWLANGDWARFDNVNFGSTPARDFVARVASGAAGGVSGLVEVRIDNVNNAPIGSFAIGNTGGWQSWRTVPGQRQRGDRHAHRLPDVHQRPAGRLRERQLVPVPPLALGGLRRVALRRNEEDPRSSPSSCGDPAVSGADRRSGIGVVPVGDVGHERLAVVFDALDQAPRRPPARAQPRPRRGHRSHRRQPRPGGVPARSCPTQYPRGDLPQTSRR